ncbi:MAG: hypothetical protein AAFX85_12690, partial [Pseudomonadota bacterium]
AQLVPVSPTKSVMLPQVRLSHPTMAVAADGLTGRVSLAKIPLPVELMRINSLRLAKEAPNPEDVQRLAMKGRMLFRTYAWWFAAQAAEVDVCLAPPTELLNLLHWPTLGKHLDRTSAMRACTALSRVPRCRRDLAILAQLPQPDVATFVTAGAILRFVELTGEEVPSRRDRDAAVAPDRGGLTKIISGIRRRLGSDRD